jgi:heterodisulfide reductase subunit C
MGKLFDALNNDVRFIEAFKACMNCGVCTAICPAADYYDYDPRIIVNIVQTRNEEEIEKLLKSDTIWYCGECMSCKTRCPRGNVPGLIIMALRSLSQDLGYFIESEKGRQQYAVLKTVGLNILELGYCVHPDKLLPENHPEQGPVWEWVYKNRDEVMNRLTSNFRKEGPGAMRKIPDSVLDEIKKIFDVTGGTERFEKVRKISVEKAKEEGLTTDEDIRKDEYFKKVNTTNSNNHTK